MLVPSCHRFALARCARRKTGAAAERLSRGALTVRHTKILIVATIAVITGLLLRSAIRNDEWVGFAVTEIQLLVPLAIAWRVLGARGA